MYEAFWENEIFKQQCYVSVKILFDCAACLQFKLKEMQLAFNFLSLYTGKATHRVGKQSIKRSQDKNHHYLFFKRSCLHTFRSLSDIKLDS